MKKTILLSGVLMLLFSCEKNEKVQNEAEAQYQELLSQTQADIGFNKKPLKKLIFKNLDEIEDSKEMNLQLLSKVATNLKIKYSDIKIKESSSINYDDQTTFFVLTTVAHDKKAFRTNDDDEELGDYFQRKYLFVNREDGSIIAEEFDENLGYYDNEAIQFSKSHILKDLFFLNEKTPAIAFYTEARASSRIVLYSEQKFTLITLGDKEIRKVLYEYPVQLTNGDSNGTGTFQIETLETGMSFSDHKTNGYFDLIITKKFSYEEAVEDDLENGIEEKSDLKTKKEIEKIKFNGRDYAFHRDDRHRFLE
ncbi:PA3715 family protein [Flavobacterium sp. 3-218]